MLKRVERNKSKLADHNKSIDNSSTYQELKLQIQKSEVIKTLKINKQAKLITKIMKEAALKVAPRTKKGQIIKWRCDKKFNGTNEKTMDKDKNQTE